MSLNPKTIEKRKHNRKTYRSYIFRVRRDSDLERLLLNHAAEGDTSVNFLMTDALCDYFGCARPHREYKVRKHIWVFTP